MFIVLFVNANALVLSREENVKLVIDVEVLIYTLELVNHWACLLVTHPSLAFFVNYLLEVPYSSLLSIIETERVYN